MKQPASRQARKTIMVCPRCGKKQSVLTVSTKFMILCPLCGAGMRERQVRARLAD